MWWLVRVFSRWLEIHFWQLGRAGFWVVRKGYWVNLTIYMCDDVLQAIWNLFWVLYSGDTCVRSTVTLETWIAIDPRDIGTAQAIGVLMRYIAVLEFNSVLISIFTKNGP